GLNALLNNIIGDFNTAIGAGADVSAGSLTNATAIGSEAIVNASNKIRLGNDSVTVIEGKVAFTASSDKTKKENFEPVDGEEVLGKIRGFELSSWNFIGHDPKEVSPLWSNGARLLCGLRPRRIRTDRLGDHNKPRRHSSDSYDRGAGSGEAHGGAKTERGADCCAGIAAGGAGVSTEPPYPDHGREKRLNAVTVTGMSYALSEGFLTGGFFF